MHAGIATFPLVSTFEYKFMENFSFIKHFNFFKKNNKSICHVDPVEKNDFFKMCGCFRWRGDCDLNFLLTLHTVDTDTLISVVALSQEAALGAV